MSPEKMIYMANQIATFFESKPHDEGVQGVADHINAFWEPRMRRQLFVLLDSGTAGFKSLLLEAALAIRRPVDEAAAAPTLAESV